MNDEIPSAIPSYITSVLRTLLGAAAGWLMGKGYFTDVPPEQLVGIGLAVATGIWSLISRMRSHKRLAAAVAAPAGKLS